MWNAAIVGARVKVYWEREHSWHPGRIIKYNATKGRHKCGIPFLFSGIFVVPLGVSYVIVVCHAFPNGGGVVPRIRYEDEDTEWLDIGRHSNRVLVDDRILRITDTMKRHLGIPLDGYRSATTDVVVARYRPVTPPERRVAKVQKPWIPPWEREEATRVRQVMRGCSPVSAVHAKDIIIVTGPYHAFRRKRRSVLRRRQRWHRKRMRHPSFTPHLVVGSLCPLSSACPSGC
jgi:hypothetical protein